MNVNGLRAVSAPSDETVVPEERGALPGERLRDAFEATVR